MNHHLRFYTCIVACLSTCISLSNCLHAQDSSRNSLLSPAYIRETGKKAAFISSKLEKKITKSLNRFQQQEKHLKADLFKEDSIAALAIFSDADTHYKQLEQKLSDKELVRNYIPKLDTLATSLGFLEQNPRFLSNSSEMKEKIDHTLSQVKDLKEQFGKAETIKRFIEERKQYLNDQLKRFGLAKQLKKLNKEAYYYTQQVKEYKELLNDSKKTERKALELLNKTSFFQNFMRKNSQLASLFRTPDTGTDDPITNLAGLQTKTQVTGMIQQQITMGGPMAQQQFNAKLQNAQSELNQLKNKVIQSGGHSSDDIVPDFKPNQQKTKSFFQRLEVGTNIQTQKAQYSFPVTSDIGFSLGYKINDKSIVGVGSSFKIGLGNSWKYIRISSQGAGVRSYADLKLKGSFWISGGFEMNYRQEIRKIEVLKQVSAWQQSGLLGITKVISMQTKFFRKTKLQLLWDFLSYRQVPRPQSILFRVGYNLK